MKEHSNKSYNSLKLTSGMLLDIRLGRESPRTGSGVPLAWPRTAVTLHCSSGDGLQTVAAVNHLSVGCQIVVEMVVLVINLVVDC